MNFSSSLRERVVAEALSRSQTQGEIAEQFGVGRSTVQNWLRQSRKNGSKMDSKTKKPQSWSREQRLEALLETHQLSEEAPGEMVPRTWSSHAPSGAVAERVDEGYVEHGPRDPIATPGES